MDRFSELPIASQVLITFGLICVFLAANGGLLVVNLRTIERRNAELQSRILPEQKIGNDVVRNLGLLQAEVLRHVMITDAEGMRIHDQFIRQIREENAGKLAEYQKLIHQERDRRIYARASQAGDVYFERTDSLLALSRAHENIEKIRLAVSAQAPAYDEYQKAIKRMIDLSEQEARALATTSTRLISNAEITDTLLLGLAIAIVIGAGFTVIGIVRRIREDNRALQKAGEALRESEERFRSYFELGLIGTAISSPTKGVVEVNDEICRILGYERSELLRMTWAELTHPDDLTADVAHFNRVLAGETDGYAIDKRFIRKDGRVIDATISVKCLRRADGSVDYFVALLQDITERKQAEDRLRRSEEKFKTLFGIAPVGISVLDRQHNVIEANPALAQITRLRREDLLNGKHPHRTILNADGTPKLPHEFTSERAMAENRPIHNAEAGILLENNEIIWVQVSVAPLALPEASAVVITQDITERKQAEQALRESEERFRELAENINEVFWIWTAVRGNAQCLYVSSAYTTIWGRSCESLYSSPRSWMEALHPQDKERVLEEGARMDFEKITDWTYRIVRPDQSIRWIRDRIFPVRDVKGVVVRFAGIAEDITKRKEAEEQVRKANRQLRILSRRRIQEQEDERRRLSRELHDQIGQSLTAAKINVEALRKTKNPALMGRLDETAAILDQLLGQVRQISLDLRPPMLDDLGLVPALRSFIDEQGRRASVAVRFSAENIPEKLDPEIQITCFRIAQEAITNAVRHAKATQLDIALRYKNGKTLQLLVRDNGIGFNARSAQAQADDLGLIGMKERASLVGGRARIMSLLGKGTKISVSLPLTFQPERQGHHMGK